MLREPTLETYHPLRAGPEAYIPRSPSQASLSPFLLTEVNSALPDSFMSLSEGRVNCVLHQYCILPVLFPMLDFFTFREELFSVKLSTLVLVLGDGCKDLSYNLT